MPNDNARDRGMSEFEYDMDDIENVFSIYSDMISKISEASSSINNIFEKLSELEKAIRRADPSGDLRLPHILRIRVVLSIVLPARQHLDRLMTRMKTCASMREDVIADAKRQKPTFE